uniref:Uncharacterized protein n=1 Tax=Anguilla anguilla TaxID=7936 RepID=A0A0E9U875_ANGAN
MEPREWAGASPATQGHPDRLRPSSFCWSHRGQRYAAVYLQHRLVVHVGLSVSLQGFIGSRAS